MFIAGIIPAPHEPPKGGLNHYATPIVDEFLEFWDPDVKYSRIAFHEGRFVRVALAAVICDLLAARKISGFGSPTCEHLCTFCHVGRRGAKQIEGYHLRSLRFVSENLRCSLLHINELKRSKPERFSKAEWARAIVNWVCAYYPSLHLGLTPFTARDPTREEPDSNTDTLVENPLSPRTQKTVYDLPNDPGTIINHFPVNNERRIYAVYPKREYHRAYKPITLYRSSAPMHCTFPEFEGD